MLVLSRRIGERIIIDDQISIEVVAIRDDKVRLGIIAPDHVRIDREEIHALKMNDERSGKVFDDAA